MEPATLTQGSGDKGGGGGVVVGMTMPPEPNWSKDVKEIGDSIANLTLAQCVQLSTYLEEVHGLKCSNSVPKPPDLPPPPKDAIPEQTEWSVIYEGFDPTKKINLVKVFREVSGQGLKEAMDFITNGTGKPIKEGCAHGEVEILKNRPVRKSP